MELMIRQTTLAKTGLLAMKAQIKYFKHKKVEKKTKSVIFCLKYAFILNFILHLFLKSIGNVRSKYIFKHTEKCIHYDYCIFFFFCQIFLREL